MPESAIATMAPDCIVFSLANPIPEVDPDMAAKYAAVVATGRSDLPNQINNVLAFPGIFRGAIDAGAHSITEEMKLAAAAAIADVVGDEVRADYVVPEPAGPAGGRGRRRGGGRVRAPGGRHPLTGRAQSPLTLTIWRSVCRTSTRSSASAITSRCPCTRPGSRRGTRRVSRYSMPAIASSQVRRG